jgi:hypothetical protein
MPTVGVQIGHNAVYTLKVATPTTGYAANHELCHCTERLSSQAREARAEQPLAMVVVQPVRMLVAVQ